MRIVLFISIWVLSFTQSLTAQTLQDHFPILVEWESFVTSHKDQATPNEEFQLKNARLDAESEKGGVVKSDMVLLKNIRTNYWKNLFFKEHRDEIIKAQFAKSKTPVVLMKTGGDPIENPALTGAGCGMNIVIVIDRSGSLDDEGPSIEAGLLALINNQNVNNTGNTITFVGMGERNNAGVVIDPIHSATITYDPGSTASHTSWINSTLSFGGTCDQCDSWSTGLTEAADFPADLVIIITDGDDDQGSDEPDHTCAAANDLKENGTHLFVMGVPDPGYDAGSLQGAVQASIDSDALEASVPPSLNELSTFDFMTVTNGFTNLGIWLSVIEGGVGAVETTSIWPRECILHDFKIKGDYEVCHPLTATAVDLQFWHNGVLQLTVSATLSNNGRWGFSSELADMVALGLSYGTWYDVIPVLTLSDGSTVTGEEFISGQDNDLYFADQSDPIVIVNDSPTDFTTSMTRFCEGSPIYYHGTDPLSGNHFSAIRRKHKNSGGGFGEYQGEGWMSVSLDGFTGDLNEQYPGYFQVDYIYQLYIASYNGDPDVCIAWTPVLVEFEIVDCCKPDFVLIDVPECVEDGEPFTVRVEILAPLTAADIYDIYSSYPNFSGGDFTVVSANGSSLIIDITFTSENCTCEGEMLVFDIIFECGGIWIMTEKLPCCAEPCKKTSIVDWSAEDCIIVNGKPARKFCLDVKSLVGISGVLAGSNDSPCQVSLEDLQITSVSPGIYTVCGYMVFEDPDCTFHAEVSLILETENGCCTISQSFSFPGDCVPPEGCIETVPNIEVIYGTSIHVSLNLPTGAHVIVTDVINGSSTGHIVGSVDCGPFLLSPSTGGPVSGQRCNGIILPGDRDVDCRPTEENPEPSFPYHFVITYGECTWVLIGDYCDEFIVYPALPNDGGGTRSTEGEAVSSLSDQVRIFPNPIDQSGVLNFDLGKTKAAMQEVRITDISGRTIESFLPASDQKVFQHRLSQPLVHGIYFAIIQFDDGTQSSTKLVAIE